MDILFVTSGLPLLILGSFWLRSRSQGLIIKWRMHRLMIWKVGGDAASDEWMTHIDLGVMSKVKVTTRMLKGGGGGGGGRGE